MGYLLSHAYQAPSLCLLPSVYLYVCFVNVFTRLMPNKYHHCACFRLSTFMYVLFMCLHAPIQKVMSEGVQLWHFLLCFFFDEGRVDGVSVDPNTAISGPLSARQQNAIEMAFCWRADVGPTSNVGLVFHQMLAWFYRGSGRVLLRNPIFSWFFRGVPLSPPPLSPHMVSMCECTTRNTQSWKYE